MDSPLTQQPVCDLEANIATTKEKYMRTHSSVAGPDNCQAASEEVG